MHYEVDMQRSSSFFRYNNENQIHVGQVKYFFKANNRLLALINQFYCNSEACEFFDFEQNYQTFLNSNGFNYYFKIFNNAVFELK